jgi:hypothetical protein
MSLERLTTVEEYLSPVQGKYTSSTSGKRSGDIVKHPSIY